MAPGSILLAPGAVLILDGAGITIEGPLDVRGTLVIRAAPGAKVRGGGTLGLTAVSSLYTPWAWAVQPSGHVEGLLGGMQPDRQYRVG